MIYIEFTQRKCNKQDLIHKDSETECKLAVKLETSDLEIVMDELFYETSYSDISLILLNRLEKVLNDLEVSCSMNMLDHLTRNLIDQEHSLIVCEEIFLNK